MSTWFFIILAIAANVSANLCLKIAARSLETTSFPSVATGLLTSVWAWAGGVSCIVLLASYVIAIRTLPLSVSYAMVTIISLSIITIWGGFLGDESFSLLRAGGIVLISAGTLLLVLSTS